MVILSQTLSNLKQSTNRVMTVNNFNNVSALNRVVVRVERNRLSVRVLAVDSLVLQMLQLQDYLNLKF